MSIQTNIDNVRAEIMALESATVFDDQAWQRVLADLRAAGRVSALADAERRMETARGNQIMHVMTDMGMGGDEIGLTLVLVSAETDSKTRRVAQANQLLQVIAGCGRRFFCHQGRVSRFELDARGRVWFIDAYREARIYTHYTSGRWHGFSEGGTLRDLVIKLRQFIQYGYDIGYMLGPFPDWYSGGDPWGYGESMKIVQDCAMKTGVARRCFHE